MARVKRSLVPAGMALNLAGSALPRGGDDALAIIEAASVSLCG